MLTRKHFAAIAAILETTPELSPKAHHVLVNRFAVYFSLENDRFDFDAFEDAASRHHFACCNAPADMGHMFGCPNNPENAPNE